MAEITHIFEKRSVNTKTGEIITAATGSVKYFDDEKGYLFWPNRNKVATFIGIDLPDIISDADAGKMLNLAKHTHKNSNLIFCRSNNFVKPATLSNISKYINISYRRAVIFINKMIRMGIIGRVIVKVGSSYEIQYYINPIYFFNGKWLSANLYFLFRKDLEKILPEYVKREFLQSKEKPAGTNIYEDV